MRLNIKTILSVVFVAVFALAVAHASDVPDIQKIDKILQQQEEILKQLAEIKSELNVVKIRATNS